MDVSTINQEVDQELIREALLEALNERGWVASILSGRWFVRSPDFSLSIFFDQCTVDQVIDTVNRWRPSPAMAVHVH